MVTLQILVLSFLVRVRVPQQKKIAKSLKIKHLAIFLFHFWRDFGVIDSDSTPNQSPKISNPPPLSVKKIQVYNIFRIVLAILEISAKIATILEFNSHNTEGKPVDISKRNPLMRQLDPIRDAELIGRYSDSHWVLGW